VACDSALIHAKYHRNPSKCGVWRDFSSQIGLSKSGGVSVQVGYKLDETNISHRLSVVRT
jgi:hypothetical protein